MTIELKNTIMKKKIEHTAEAELTEDVLSINCRGCTKAPDFTSPGCMRCIIFHISQLGSAGRIRLRTSKDMELFGPAADTLCELAGFYRSPSFSMNKGNSRACSSCDHSCQKIMEIVWSGFPDPNFESARSRLMSFHQTDSRCNICIQKSYRALDQAELGMRNLKKKISLETARTGGGI